MYLFDLDLGETDLEWDFLVLHEEHLELTDTDSQVTVRKLVGNVKPEGTKLSPLNHDSMEEAQGEKEVLKLNGL